MAIAKASPIFTLTVIDGSTLTYDNNQTPCVVGRNGVRVRKIEGDGATPAGRFPLRRVLFRSDRISTPNSGLPISAIAGHAGWCTDPMDPHYNQQIELPYSGSHEELWREDSLYDLIVVISYNDAPAVPGAGSAIFLHTARPGMLYTEGCIAVPERPLLEIVAQCGPSTNIVIEP